MLILGTISFPQPSPQVYASYEVYSGHGLPRNIFTIQGMECAFFDAPPPPGPRLVLILPILCPCIRLLPVPLFFRLNLFLSPAPVDDPHRALQPHLAVLQ